MFRFRLNAYLLAIAAFAGLLSAAGQPLAADESVPWLTDFEKAMARAEKEDKFIVMDVFAEWCGPCQQMKRTTWKDSKVVRELTEKYVPVQIDADAEGLISSQYGVDSLPTVLVLTSEGTPFARKVGYQSADTLLAFLEDASKIEEEISALKEKVKENPEDIESVLELAELQRMFDQTDESITMLQRYRNLMDQDTPEDTRARFAFQLGVAYLIEESYGDGLAALEPFLTTYKEHDLAPAATELYGIGTVEYARTQVEHGREPEARKLLADLASHEHQPYLQELSKHSLTMLDAIKEKQKELEEPAAETAPTE